MPPAAAALPARSAACLAAMFARGPIAMVGSGAEDWLAASGAAVVTGAESGGVAASVLGAGWSPAAAGGSGSADTASGRDPVAGGAASVAGTAGAASAALDSVLTSPGVACGA